MLFLQAVNGLWFASVCGEMGIFVPVGRSPLCALPQSFDCSSRGLSHWTHYECLLSSSGLIVFPLEIFSLVLQKPLSEQSGEASRDETIGRRLSAGWSPGEATGDLCSDNMAHHAPAISHRCWAAAVFPLCVTKDDKSKHWGVQSTSARLKRLKCSLSKCTSWVYPQRSWHSTLRAQKQNNCWKNTNLISGQLGMWLRKKWPINVNPDRIIRAFMNSSKAFVLINQSLL